MSHDYVKGARASAVIYSLSETAKLNNLKPYHYFKYLLTELPKECFEGMGRWTSSGCLFSADRSGA